MIQNLKSGIAAAVMIAAMALPAQAQTNVLWLPTGVDDYNQPNNWDNGTAFIAVPDAGFNERSVINNGGTAFLSATPVTPTGGVILGLGAADVGILEIRSGGNLTSHVGTLPGPNPPDGSVVVGAAGRGTLRVLSGGTLTGTALSSGGNEASSIVLGDSLAAAANVNISGTINLSRTTRMKRNAAVTAGTLNLQSQSNYIAEISNLGLATPNVTGNVSLGGRLAVEFSGVMPSAASTFNLFEAGLVTGAFDSIQVSPNTSLNLGQKWVVESVPAGAGRQFAQLKIDEFLVLNVNRGTGEQSITNPGTLAKSLDAYSILSSDGSLLPASWNSLDDQNVLGGDWGEANPTASRLSELKAGGSSTFTGGASRSLGIANTFNPVSFGTDSSDDITFEYTRSDGKLVDGIVNYIGDPNSLLLTVDPTTGEARIKNTSPFTVAIDSYTIRSTSGSLLTSGWSSLDDQNALGGDWGEANPTENRLTELKAAGSTTLTPGTAFGLGNLFNATGLQDLQFEFLFGGEQVPRTGIVTYSAPSSLPGDFDGDGDVDGRDFLVWQRGGSPNQLSASDLADWQATYGAGSFTADLSAANVPEPTALLLVVCGFALCGVSRLSCVWH
jgi:hypothetical protein